MATARKWSNVAIAMQSAIAATKTITAITKANPGVASSTSHGYSNGDYVYLTVVGMGQVNDRVVRVASVATDTFQLEGIDTTNFDTFVSGTAQKLTFANSITSATTMSNSGGTFDYIDTTTIHGNQKTQMPGLPSAQTYTFDNIWDPADAGQVAMKTASDAQSKLAFKFTFGTGGPIMVFGGYVGFTGAPAGSAQSLITAQATITSQGNTTLYSS